jgi:hypothetical protein
MRTVLTERLEKDDLFVVNDLPLRLVTTDLFHRLQGLSRVCAPLFTRLFRTQSPCAQSSGCGVPFTRRRGAGRGCLR